MNVGLSADKTRPRRQVTGDGRAAPPPVDARDAAAAPADRDPLLCAAQLICTRAAALYARFLRAHRGPVTCAGPARSNDPDRCGNDDEADLEQRPGSPRQ